MNKRLNKELIQLKENGLYPLHMPGHKRNIDKGLCGEAEEISENGSFGSLLRAAYDIDITEIDGFDNLHDAKDLILDAERRAASLYKSDETHFLVNGSSAGILAAISSVCDRGTKIIVARNCHISVFNAIELNGLEPIYINPKKLTLNENGLNLAGSIGVDDIEKVILSNPDAKAIVITSPTYDGVLSDIYGIAKVSHEYDIPLIVDEAHGALFYIEGRSAVINKADIVINSVHKTLPAFTQTALIHLNGNIIDRDKVKKYLRVFQTSSPSYILMGSIDYAVEIMEEKGNALYRDFCLRTVKLKEKLSKLRNLHYISKDELIRLGIYDFDESKVLIETSSTCLNGKDIYNILRQNGFQPEMAAGNYVLLMTTLFDDDEKIEELSKVLYKIDDKVNEYQIDSIEDEYRDSFINNLSDKVDKVSEKTVFAYPPGIPIVVKGEVITRLVVDEIEKAVNNRLDIKIVD